MDELKWTSISENTRPASSTNDGMDNFSGLEMVSAEKSAAQYNTGKLSTSWIGHKGLCEIENSMIVEKCQLQIKTLRNELNLLAKECTNAFVAAGMLESEDPQITKAVKLCDSYYASNRQKVRAFPAFVSTWKDQGDQPENDQIDQREYASLIIGKSLVETITEENHQPPDVSIDFNVTKILS